MTLVDATKYMALNQLLLWMQERGSSVRLTWIVGAWECEWVVDGERYVGIHPNPDQAVRNAVAEAQAAEEVKHG